MTKAVRRADAILLLAVLAFAAGLFLFWPRGSGDVVVVTVEQQEYARLPLGRDARLEIENSLGERNVLVIENGCAQVIEADCSNQVCVQTAPISAEGQMIVCLPHKVVVFIETDGQ